MRAGSLLCGVLAGALAVACGDDDPTGPEQFIYGATLSGANERPTAVTTSGTGTFHGALSAGGVLNYTISWSGLGSNSNAAHIHGPITPGSTAAAGVLIDLNAPTEGRTVTHGTNGSGTASGTIDLNVALNATVSADSLRKLFNNQGLYVNVHTVNNPGGEIAGVITRAAN